VAVAVLAHHQRSGQREERSIARIVHRFHTKDVMSDDANGGDISPSPERKRDKLNHLLYVNSPTFMPLPRRILPA
jgi:hypothetical protein